MKGDNNKRQLDSETLKWNLQRELVVKINLIAKVLYFYFQVMFLEHLPHVNHWE